MDPNANLNEQRKIAALILTVQDQCSDDGTYTGAQLIELAYQSCRLAELVQALDAWIASGGFQPAAWTIGPAMRQGRI